MNPEIQKTTSQEDIEKNKAIAIVGYLIFFIPILAAKDSVYAKYHANQALVLFLFWLIGMGISSILMIVLISLCTFVIVGIVGTVLTIIGMMNAANGKMEPLPLIGAINILK